MKQHKVIKALRHILVNVKDRQLKIMKILLWPVGDPILIKSKSRIFIYIYLRERERERARATEHSGWPQLMVGCVPKKGSVTQEGAHFPGSKYTSVRRLQKSKHYCGLAFLLLFTPQLLLFFVFQFTHLEWVKVSNHTLIFLKRYQKISS